MCPYVLYEHFESLHKICKVGVIFPFFRSENYHREGYVTCPVSLTASGLKSLSLDKDCLISKMGLLLHCALSL